MKRFFVFFLISVIGCLSWFVSPVMAGTCTIACVQGSNTRSALDHQPSASEEACRSLCTAAPANGATPARPAACRNGETCQAQYDAGTAAPSAQGVCECRCVPGTGGGGDPVTVQSTETCPTIAPEAQECVDICNRRCANPVAPVRTRMVRNPAGNPRCLVPAAPATQPSTDAPTSNSSNAAIDRGVVPLELSQPIQGVRVVNDFGDYIALVYKFLIGIAGGVAAIMLVYGGFLYLLGSASQDVGTGKQIIVDAIIGLVLVLGSYMILATVNPNTLRLQVPPITPITQQAIPPDTVPPPPTTNICGNPRLTPAFRRRPVSSQRRPTGQPCAYDSECASGMCFMHNQTQGVCSDLTDGQRCKCIGSCCDAMTQSNQDATYLPDTNNRGSGNAPCTGGSVCQFREDDWRCTRLTYAAGGSGSVQTGSPQRPAANTHPICRLDSECVTALGTGAACMYNSRQPGSLTGRTECSLGREGDQCQCSGTGCDLVAPPLVRVEGTQVPLGNNHGTRAIPCREGLVCVPFVRPAGTIQDPRDLEYFCQRPATLQTAPAPTLECRFRCASDRTTVRRVPGCTREGGEGVRECGGPAATACGGAAGALGVRCVPTTSDYLLPTAPAAPTWNPPEFDLSS